jgi:methionyl-tRNA formyltransferase
MSEQMDAGDIIAQARIVIPEDEWPLQEPVLEELLGTEGGNLLAETLPAWMKGEITPEKQDESKATFTKKFTDEDARIEVLGDPEVALRKIRAFTRSPRPYFLATRSGKEMRVIITEATVLNGKLEIQKVIPEGKREMDYSEFLRSGGKFPNSSHIRKKYHSCILKNTRMMFIDWISGPLRIESYL